MIPDIARVTALLEEVAAEEIMPRFRALADEEVRRKKGGELVTVADEAAEERLERALRDLLPGSAALGEEAAASDPELFRHLGEEAPVWIIDPVDGTGNFAAGRPVFVVMVALVQDGETRVAWIHDPLAASTAVAEQGSGAWRGGVRLSVAVPAGREAWRGTLHVGQFGGEELRRRVEVLRPKLGAVRSLRCAGQEYLRMAAGETHYSLFTKLMPWDHAPGTLLVREAGGVARLLDGREYQPTIVRGPPLLAASDQGTWDDLRGLLAQD